MDEDKLKFETKPFFNGEFFEKRVYIGGEYFDWSIDHEALEYAKNMGPEYLRIAQQDIENHFAECVSDFINRRVTVEDIKKATKTGLI
jgi:hypothetical protein